jgi:hypothetical protein
MTAEDYYDYKGFKNAIGIQNDTFAKPLYGNFKEYTQKVLEEGGFLSEAFESWIRKLEDID